MIQQQRFVGVLTLCLFISACLISVHATARSLRHTAARRDQRAVQQQVKAAQQRRAVGLNQSPVPLISFSTFEQHGHSPLDEADTFSQVSTAISQSPDKAEPDNTVLLEVQAQAQVQRVRSYCEICILVMQMKQRGEPHLCAGLNANYYITVSVEL